jgi:anti-sigma B factor antagonist
MLIDGGQRRLVLDLDGLTFCDSAGISAFVRLRRRLSEVDGALVLARPTPIVRSVLDLTGMVELIAVTTTLDEARTAARD